MSTPHPDVPAAEAERALPAPSHDAPPAAALIVPPPRDVVDPAPVEAPWFLAAIGGVAAILIVFVVLRRRSSR